VPKEDDRASDDDGRWAAFAEISRRANANRPRTYEEVQALMSKRVIGADEDEDEPSGPADIVELRPAGPVASAEPPEPTGPPGPNLQGTLNDLAKTSGQTSAEMGSRGATSRNRVVYQEHHDRADDGHEHAPRVESCYACGASKGEQEPPGNRADDAEDNVQDDASTLLVHDLAGDKAGD
jgi:hypothetical protein